MPDEGNTASDPNGFLMRFTDGPLAGYGNVQALDGHYDCIVPSEAWSWPLPNRLGVLAHLQHISQVAMWDADDPDAALLPVEITASPNAVVYRKASQSKMPEGASHVVRGAEYCLEHAESND